jgi:FAD/FMN-containing dehydrogenase
MADGSHVRADEGVEPELFWAVRGGGGNFGVVTAVEFELFPIETAYAGMLIWDWREAGRVLARWSEWASGAPDEETTAWRILQLPDLPEIPAVVRGRQIVVIDGALLGSDDEAAAALAPLRELRPEIDTFARVPAASLARLHMDPEGPTPSVTDTTMLGSLPAGAADALVGSAGPGSGSSLLLAELRQLGGALERPSPTAGALPMLDGQFLLFGAAVAATPEMAARGAEDARRLVDAMTPWANGRSYLNFAERAVDSRIGYDDVSFARLQAVRRAVDPHGLFVANHRISHGG